VQQSGRKRPAEIDRWIEAKKDAGKAKRKGKKVKNAAKH
jgi:hypothetical protein